MKKLFATTIYSLIFSFTVLAQSLVGPITTTTDITDPAYDTAFVSTSVWDREVTINLIYDAEEAEYADIVIIYYDVNDNDLGSGYYYNDSNSGILSGTVYPIIYGSGGPYYPKKALITCRVFTNSGYEYKEFWVNY